MAVFLVLGSSADGIIKKQKGPVRRRRGLFWVNDASSSARNQQAIRRKRSPSSSMLIEARSYGVYGGKVCGRQRPSNGVAHCRCRRGACASEIRFDFFRRPVARDVGGIEHHRGPDIARWGNSHLQARHTLVNDAAVLPAAIATTVRGRSRV
jgi:hypothetical protein